jgi:hypothetical protein
MADGNQQEYSPCSTGIVAILAYAKPWGINMTPMVMPAMTSCTSHRQL